MDMIDTLSKSLDHTAEIVGGVKADQLTSSTPCTKWTVTELLAHMNGALTNMGNGAVGEALLPSTNEFALSDDLADQYRTQAAKTLAAWQACDLESLVDIGAGPMPAGIAISINIVDQATHAWDLARATDQPADLDDELAATVLAIAQGFVTDQTRTFAGIDPPIEVGADASPTAQLVAFMGRRP